MYANAFMCCLFIYYMKNLLSLFKHIHLTVIWYVTLFVHVCIDVYVYVCIRNQLYDLWS